MLKLRHNPNRRARDRSMQGELRLVHKTGVNQICGRVNHTEVLSLENCLRGEVCRNAVRRSANAFVLQCDDGVRFPLDGTQNLLMTGDSPLLFILRDATITYALRYGACVLVISNGLDEDGYRLLANKNDVGFNTITDAGFSPGFRPFAGWNERSVMDFLVSYAAPESRIPARNQSHLIRKLLQLSSRYAQIQDVLLSSGLSVQELITAVSQTDIPADEKNAIADMLRNDRQMAEQVLDALSQLFSLLQLQSDSELWTVGSPGITYISGNYQSFSDANSAVWMFVRLLTKINAQRLLSTMPVLLILDRIDAQTVREIQPLINSDGMKLMMITDNIMAMDQEYQRILRGRVSCSIVLTQTDSDAAGYWSKMTGERREMRNERSTTQSSSIHPFEFFATETTGTNIRQVVEYRPNYEAEHFLNLREREGFLFASGGISTYHRFFYDSDILDGTQLVRGGREE